MNLFNQLMQNLPAIYILSWESDNTRENIIKFLSGKMQIYHTFYHSKTGEAIHFSYK